MTTDDAVLITGLTASTALVDAFWTASGTAGRAGSIFAAAIEGLEDAFLPDIFSTSRAGPSGSDVTENIETLFDGTAGAQAGVSKSDISKFVSGISTMPTCCW